ncbi:MAG: 3-dehydroquinate synthase family protein, partial [Gemmatimonadales bacterium]
PRGKNLVGAFHPPAAVITDPHALETLPEAQYRAGLAETVKHGLTQDAEYLAWIEANAGAILARSPAAVLHLVRRSIELKAAVVQRDELESGERAILNAGHTVAHGLESASGFSLSHGEAVAIGLVAECRLAAKLRLADPGVAERVENILISLGLPVHPPAGLDRGAATEAIRHDKKNRAGAIRFSLPEAPGRMHRRSGAWTVGVDPEVVATLMREM